MVKKRRAFLKWAGNKIHCIETILNSLPPAKRLIEPFTGSGAIFVNSDYEHYLLAEKNNDLITLFKYLQQEGEAFIDYCAGFFILENNCAEKYYYFREQFNQTNDSRYKSALFLYLNRHGFNGLCRYNNQGLYNVPFGRFTRPYFPRQEMLYFQQKSHKAQFIQKDFRQTFAKAQAGDLIYCDPPYVPFSRSFSYIQNGFSEQDQLDLVTLAQNSAQQGITVAISNHDMPWTRHHYRHGKLISFPVKRWISCKSTERRSVREVLVIFDHSL